MEWYWVVLLIIVIVLVVAGGIALIAYAITRLKMEFEPTALGGTCALDTDCVGWGPATTASACCNGTCQQKKADWAGVGYCPTECRGCPGCPEGSCGPPYGASAGVSGMAAWHWPRIVDEPCNLSSDCEGWGPGATATACCSGFCKTKEVDWAGIGYCPNECRGCAGCPQGSCGNWHTPRLQGEPCALDNDCDGWSLFGDVACCNFHCITKDETLQTCPAFCNENPDTCSAPYPN